MESNLVFSWYKVESSRNLRIVADFFIVVMNIYIPLGKSCVNVIGWNLTNHRINMFLYYHRLLLLVLVLFTLLVTVHSVEPTGCIAMENMYVSFSNDTINSTYVKFEVHALGRSGWYGVGFGKQTFAQEMPILVVNFPNNGSIMQVVNHTTFSPIVQPEIIPISVDTSVWTAIEGNKVFSFKIPLSLLKDRDWIYFANTYDFNGNVTISHSSYGIRFGDLYNRVNDFSLHSFDCSNYLHKSGRIAGFTPWSFFCALLLNGLLMILCIFCRDIQPYKSRGHCLEIMIVLYTTNMAVEFFGPAALYFEGLSKICWINLWTYPQIVGSGVVYTIMSFRYFLMKIIENRKSRLYERIKTNQQGMDATRFSPWINRGLLILSSPWIAASVAIAWLFCEMGVFAIIYGSYGFSCDQSNMRDIIRYVHVIFILIPFPLIYVGLVFYDLLSNWRVFCKECRPLKFYVDDDPFYFRIESISSIPLAIAVIVWGVVSLPDVFHIILTEICILWLMVASGGVALVISLYRYGRSLCVKQAATMDERMAMAEVFHVPSIFDLFLSYCKKEWSMENLLIYQDIEKYRGITVLETRKNFASEIFHKYLNGSSSPFEVNLDATTIDEVRTNMAQQKFTEDIFNGVRSVVVFNLLDTYQRFVTTFSYIDLKKDLELKRIALNQSQGAFDY
jgi:hypothetical protein